MISWKKVKLDHISSRTRSNLTKHCVLSKGHIFSPILVKLSWNVCFDGHVELGHKVGFEKHLVCAIETVYFLPILMNLGQNVCLDEYLEEFGKPLILYSHET